MKKGGFKFSPLKVNIPDIPPDILALSQKRFNLALPEGVPNDLLSLAKAEVWDQLSDDLHTTLNLRVGRNLDLKLKSGAIDPVVLPAPFYGSIRKSLSRQPKRVLDYLASIGALDDASKLNRLFLSNLVEGIGVSARVAFKYLLHIRQDVDLANGDDNPTPVGITIKEEIRRTFDELIPASMKDRERIVEILCARYGSQGENESTLQAVGDKKGLTRERVRQLQAKIVDRAVFRKPSSGLFAGLPGKIGPMLPSTVNELQDALSEILGKGQSLEGAGRFSREVLGVSPGFTICQKEAKTVDRRVISAGDREDSLSKSVKHLRNAILVMTGACGAAQIDVVRGLVNRNAGELLDDQTLVRIAGNIAGFQWLDERTGWFWLATHRGENAVLNAVSKIMVVTDRRLDIEEIYPAVVRNLRKRYNDREPYLRVLMPAWVLTEMLRQTDWLKTVQKEYFELRDPAMRTTLKKELSSIERFVLDFLESQGNVASRMELRRAYKKTRLGTEMALHMMLDRSPIVYRSERAIFALTGRDIDIKGLRRARSNVHENVSKMLDAENLSPADASFTIQLTKGAIRNYCVTIPAALARIVDGQKLVCHGAIEGVIAVKGGRMTGLIPLLRTASLAQPGKKIRFVLNPGSSELQVRSL